MKRRRALLVAVLLGCLACGLVIALTEQPFWPTGVPPGREQRAAVALRDDVTPFQKWGSRTFTAPYLEAYYDSASYFTQAAPDDQKDAFLAALAAALRRAGAESFRGGTCRAS